MQQKKPASPIQMANVIAFGSSKISISVTKRGIAMRIPITKCALVAEYIKKKLMAPINVINNAENNADMFFAIKDNIVGS